MLDKFRKKNNKDIQEKATSREAYMTGSVPAWESAGMSLRRSRSFSALMDKYSGWVFAACRINAMGVAAQTLKLYSIQPQNGMKSIVPTRKVGSTKSAYLQGKMENKPSTFVQRKAMQEEIIEVCEHPVLELLDNPSPDHDGYTLTMQRMLNLQLTGNAYLHPIVSETIGVPYELYNMQSDLVTIVPDGEFDLVASYQYGKQPNIVDFRKDEVLHERQPNPSDPFYGMGWVSAAQDAIDLLASMDGYEQNVLDNQARPDWAIMVKEHLTDGQYQRLLQQVERQLGGKNNRSRPFIFEGGTDGKPMQFSPQDLAFDSGETRKIEVIAAISGVPVTKLKANDPNLANAREGNLGWLRDTIVPYLKLDEGFLNRSLLPMFGMFADNLFLAYDDPVQADRQQQASIDASDIVAGIRTRNEIRSDRGLEPIEGGDELFVSAGTLPIEVAIDQAMNPPMPMFGSYGTAPPKAPVETDEPIIDNPEELTEAEIEGQPQQVDPTGALNGAQVTAALEIVNLVAQGQMPRESALGQLQVFFNLTEEQANSILGDVGLGFVPELIIETESKAPTPVGGQCPDGWHYMPDTDTCMEGSSHPSETYSKGVPETVDSPKAPEDREWDAGEAIKRIKKWATKEDGEISWEKYRKAFAWYDGDEQEEQGSYKLPHHDIIDGELKVVLHGVNSALAFLSRTDMPETEKPKAKGHLDYHREQFGLEVNDKAHANCSCKKKQEIDGKALWEESRSLISEKRAPIDWNNEEFKEMMEIFSSSLNGLRDDLVPLFRKEIEEFLDRTGGMGQFQTSAEFEIKIREMADKFVDDVMLTSGQNELDRLGVDLSFSYLDPVLANTLEEYKSQLVETLTRGTAKEIDDKVKLGIRHGASTDEIARDIRSLLEEEPDTGIIPIVARAEMIARTEVALVNEIGRLEAWNQSGVVVGKQWQVAAGACYSCKEMGRLQPNPIKLTDAFAGAGTPHTKVGDVTPWSPVGGVGGALKTPPLHPNCRCGMVEIYEDEMPKEFLEEQSDMIYDQAKQELDRSIDWVRGQVSSGKMTKEEGDRQIRNLKERFRIEHGR